MQNFSFISLFGKKLDGVGKFTYPPEWGVARSPGMGLRNKAAKSQQDSGTPSTRWKSHLKSYFPTTLALK